MAADHGDHHLLGVRAGLSAQQAVGDPRRGGRGARELGNPNFGVLFDTCHAHMCAAVGANQVGDKETLPGGELELLQKLKGKITHLHLIDSDGTLNEHNTSTHDPFGKGLLNFDQLIPELLTVRRAQRLVVRRPVLLARRLGRRPPTASASSTSCGRSMRRERTDSAL